MNRVFPHTEPFCVPDGTLVAPFLNSKGSQSGLPFDLIDGFSIAAGIIEPNTRSKIHFAPFVTQVTYVLEGTITITMKDPEFSEPYPLDCKAHQAALTRAGTFLELISC